MKKILLATIIVLLFSLIFDMYEVSGFSKPSVPEFTVAFFTSEIENKSTIQFTIKNQPYDKSMNASLLYNIRYKTNVGSWKEVYRADEGFPSQYSSDYTILSFSSSGEYEGHFLDTTTNPIWSYSIIVPANSIIDAQVQAMHGYVTRVYNPNSTSLIDMYIYVFVGETSDWSDTQTLTIPANTPNSTPSPTLSPTPASTLTPSSPTKHPNIEPTQPTSPTPESTPVSDNTRVENYTLTVIIVGVLALIIVVGLLVYFSKRSRKLQS